MTKNPFDAAIELPAFLTVSQTEAVGRMKHALFCKGLGILTGEIGSGKSTILRLLSDTAQTANMRFVYICRANLAPKELYLELLRAYNLSPGTVLAKIKQCWEDHLANIILDKESLAVVLDEAHEMPPATLLELRFLMNHQMDLSAPFSIILSGQPRLRAELRKQAYEAITQRVMQQYHITAMTAEDTAGYIQYRMSAMDLTSPLFSESAITFIHNSSGGIARVTNQICRHVFHSASKQDSKVIEEKHIAAVLADMDLQRGIV